MHGLNSIIKKPAPNVMLKTSLFLLSNLPISIILNMIAALSTAAPAPVMKVNNQITNKVNVIDFF